jgi:uncharacterized protein
MERELSPDLKYHSVAHTRDDVLPAAERLAAMEGIGEDDLLVLRTAVLFHDIGFIERYDDNETAGVRLAAEVLPGFGYDPVEIAVIGGMIMATKLPQSPRTHLEEIMADADLDLLGRKDFSDLNRALREERGAHGQSFSDVDWYRNQLQFLQAHRYFTASAQKLRQAVKEGHTAMMAARLRVSIARRL